MPSWAFYTCFCFSLNAIGLCAMVMLLHAMDTHDDFASSSTLPAADEEIVVVMIFDR